MLFIIKEPEIESYTDDNTPYISAENLDKSISSLEEVSKTLFKFFADSRFQVNADKYDPFISVKQKANVSIETFCTGNSESEKLSGINIECKLTIDVKEKVKS